MLNKHSRPAAKLEEHTGNAPALAAPCSSGASGGWSVPAGKMFVGLLQQESGEWGSLSPSPAIPVGLT